MRVIDNDHAGVATEDAAAPIVRRLRLNDLNDSLRQGVATFARAPLYGLVFGGVYALGGWLIIATVFLLDVPYLAYPLAIGFALIAPFACAGTYEVSRQIEQGRALTWRGVIGSVWGFVGQPLSWLSLVSLFTLILWLDFAWIFFVTFYGVHVPTLRQLAADVVTTQSGVVFLVASNGVGALIAFAVFAITVVSPPLLVDREIDFVTAMLASVRLTLANPFVMLIWAATIGALLTLSIATAFLGLFVALPVLGHASWALYRRAVGMSLRDFFHLNCRMTRPSKAGFSFLRWRLGCRFSAQNRPRSSCVAPGRLARTGPNRKRRRCRLALFKVRKSTQAR